MSCREGGGLFMQQFQQYLQQLIMDQLAHSLLDKENNSQISIRPFVTQFSNHTVHITDPYDSNLQTESQIQLTLEMRVKNLFWFVCDKYQVQKNEQLLKRIPIIANSQYPVSLVNPILLIEYIEEIMQDRGSKSCSRQGSQGSCKESRLQRASVYQRQVQKMQKYLRQHAKVYQFYKLQVQMKLYYEQLQFQMIEVKTKNRNLSQQNIQLKQNLNSLESNAIAANKKITHLDNDLNLANKQIQQLKNQLATIEHKLQNQAKHKRIVSIRRMKQKNLIQDIVDVKEYSKKINGLMKPYTPSNEISQMIKSKKKFQKYADTYKNGCIFEKARRRILSKVSTSTSREKSGEERKLKQKNRRSEGQLKTNRKCF